ncbi:RagB/SusD family nutrient uptake outer membrane protein [Flavobacterium algicola]|uniref:RagB/SusD family nutrient uptake outer membrane protein n=1 Tax=Flavobacterium algicola TaxID=556529 RepID=UPI001EFD77E8|nr:RagB/SusD family nutrient uptake outer membrane protein [Flavobacterium algicola]MCG9793163.1 RagB/SusD family nutrient uptake outer membrane protein [Flavobacterium algicola]
MKHSIKFNISYFWIFSMVFLCSCNNYLEEEIYSDQTADSFITENNADQLVVATYTGLRRIYTNYDFQFLGTDIFTAQTELFSITKQNDYVTLDSSQGLEYWASNYNVIAQANTVINRYENQINWSTSKLGDKAYGIAQAKALRGLAFFNLVQQYGGVVLQLNESLSIRSDYTRSTEQQTYEQIINDLEAAIPSLQDVPAAGRFSKRAAQHLLAEVYLTKGYKSYGSTTDFSTAAALAELAIGTYDIRTQTYAKVFDITNQVNAEVLFAVQNGTTGDVSNRTNTKHSIFINALNNYSGISRTSSYGLPNSTFVAMPTPYFYSLFAANDTREAVTINRVLYANEVATYVSSNGTDNVKVGDTVVYYPKNALSATDLAKRLNRYLVYQPTEYLYGLPANVAGSIYQYSSNINRINFPIFKKFADVGVVGSESGSRDTFIFRVAGSHLVAAEAYLAAGNATKALEHLNRVRERATGVTNFYTAVTVDTILNERALELAGEDNRWAVLKRTSKLEERIKLYNPHVIDHGAYSASTHSLRPIPAIELQLSPTTMVQNSGY